MPKNSKSAKPTIYAISSNSTIMASARWGMDFVGPLPTAQGNCKFATVAVDYFTKWVEAKASANITAPTIQKFFWQIIICRFEVPRELTVDNV
jgi:hypothetical protein